MSRLPEPEPRSNTLLIDERAIVLTPTLIEVFGFDRAVILQQLHFYLANPKCGKSINGHKWIWNSYENWQEHDFSFWPCRTIRRWFSILEKENLVISCQPKSTQWDRTKYYRINYQVFRQKVATSKRPVVQKMEPRVATSKRPKVATSYKEQRIHAETSNRDNMGRINSEENSKESSERYSSFNRGKSCSRKDPKERFDDIVSISADDTAARELARVCGNGIDQLTRSKRDQIMRATQFVRDELLSGCGGKRKPKKKPESVVRIIRDFVEWEREGFPTKRITPSMFINNWPGYVSSRLG